MQKVLPFLEVPISNSSQYPVRRRYHRRQLRQCGRVCAPQRGGAREGPGVPLSGHPRHGQRRSPRPCPAVLWLEIDLRRHRALAQQSGLRSRPPTLPRLRRHSGHCRLRQARHRGAGDRRAAAARGDGGRDEAGQDEPDRNRLDFGRLGQPGREFPPAEPHRGSEEEGLRRGGLQAVRQFIGRPHQRLPAQSQKYRGSDFACRGDPRQHEHSRGGLGGAERVIGEGCARETYPWMKRPMCSFPPNFGAKI